MKKLNFKRFYLFFYSVLLFILHLPFVFAKSKPMQRIGGKLANNKVTTTLISGTTELGKAISKAPMKLYDSLHLGSMGLAQHVFDNTIHGINYLKSIGKITNDTIVSIIDFTQPSSSKRLFIIDLQKREVLYNTYVAHGMNSGTAYANSFSNSSSSHKSSLGFYKTSSTYNGSNGYSLKLQGLEKGYNDNAENRAVVMHAANYVNEDYINSQGYIGRSHGCPAVMPQLNKPIIELIKGGSVLFIFANDMNYLMHSGILNN